MAALWLGYDTVSALVLQYGSYDQGLLIDVPWLLGFVLFGATGLHPSMRELTEPVVEPSTRLTWRRLDRARRGGAPLTVALIDLDRFKRFNDEGGHQAGDRLLKDATAAWSAALRSTDLLCRYAAKAAGRDRVTVGVLPVAAGQELQGS